MSELHNRLASARTELHNHTACSLLVQKQQDRVLYTSSNDRERQDVDAMVE